MSRCVPRRHAPTLAVVAALVVAELLVAPPVSADEPRREGFYASAALAGAIGAGPSSRFGSAWPSVGAGGLELAFGHAVAPGYALSLDIAALTGSTLSRPTNAYRGRGLVLLDAFVSGPFDLRAGLGVGGAAFAGHTTSGFASAANWDGLGGVGPACLVGGGVVLGRPSSAGPALGLDLGAAYLVKDEQSYVPVDLTVRVGVTWF
jgi:hypothetical protein